MNKLQRSLALIGIGLGLAGVACNLSTLSGTAEFSQEMIQGTVDAELTALVLSQPAPLTLEPVLTATDAATATETPTPTITPTPTSSDPFASVTQATNCRTGPGVVYDWLYALQPGTQAKIVALSTVANYVVIEIPGQAPSTCWLWMQYGMIIGSTEGLPQLTPPPTPTPAAPSPDFSLTYESWMNCGATNNVYVKLTNTGETVIESHRVEAENLDSNEMTSNQFNTFGASAACLALADPSLDPGDSGYVAAKFNQAISGDTIDFSVEACVEDGYVEPCTTKDIQINIPGISDVNAKEGFEAIDPAEVLSILADLEITRWRYAGSEREGSHIGPMAQDFNRLFQVGDGEQVIYSFDAYGVALSAAQALLEQNEQQAAQLAELEAQNAALEARLAALEARQAANGRSGWVLAVMGLIAVGWVLLKRPV